MSFEGDPRDDRIDVKPKNDSVMSNRRFKMQQIATETRMSYDGMRFMLHQLWMCQRSPCLEPPSQFTLTQKRIPCRVL